MKRLSIFAVCALLALSACKKNDDDTTLKTSIKACFGEKTVSNSQKAPLLDGVVKTSALSTTIYKQEPCNVAGFTVTAKCNGLDDVIHPFKITNPAEGHPSTTSFDLTDIYVGENTFTTKLELCTPNTTGVDIGMKEFTLDANGDFPLDSKTNLEAKFKLNEIVSNPYTIKESNNTELINLGDFTITNGGVKIKFFGNNTYNIRYLIKSELENKIIKTIPLEIKSNTAEVINDKLSGATNSGKYTITAEIAYDGQTYIAALGSKTFQISKAQCLRLGVHIDSDFNIVVKDLGNITMTIEDFTPTGDYK